MNPQFYLSVIITKMSCGFQNLENRPNQCSQYLPEQMQGDFHYFGMSLLVFTINDICLEKTWNWFNEIQRNAPSVLFTAASVPKILSWMDYSWEAHHHWENGHIMISPWFPPGLKSFHIKKYINTILLHSILHDWYYM